MQPKRYSVFVEGKACDRPLTPVDLEAEKIARYDLVTYECGLSKMGELASKYARLTTRK
jgi:hypothetical protein